MARSINFQLGERKYAGEPARIDRARLYGRVDQIATDKYGTALEKAALDEDGATIITATGQGYLDEDGRWLERGALWAVDEEGRPREQLPSSFDGSIELEPTASVDVDEYHLHEIENLYLLEGDLAGLCAECADYLKASGRLFSFPFRFREAYDSYTAFLLPREGRLFMAVGRRARVAYLGRKQRSIIDEIAEEETGAGEVEELDFSMV